VGATRKRERERESVIISTGIKPNEILMKTVKNKHLQKYPTSVT
jgi:hypothetical protein